MNRLCLLRHAPTDWNRAGRLQGRADPPLSAEGRSLVARWQLPAWARRARAWTSPLRRAIETAEWLGRPDAVPAAALIEMDWGAFEGRTLAELRAADPEGMAVLEARGLDFQPPGGESPRQVVARLSPFLRTLAQAGGDHLLITHKGVLRAALVLATGWDMTKPAPLRLDRSGALLFALDDAGRIGDLRPWRLLVAPATEGEADRRGIVA